MKKSLIIIFLLIIIMPITVLAVMAFSASQENRMREEGEREETAAQYLQIQSRLLANRLSGIEGDLLALQGDQREISRKDRLIKQAFTISGDNTFTFPDPESPLSERERAFLSEAERIDLAAALRAGYTPSEDSTVKSHWYTWFMGDGINFVNYAMEDNQITGYLLERYALISQLINVLPHSASDEDNFRIWLTDARGDILYQWGGYSLEDNNTPLAELTLKEPLGSWRLLYFDNVLLHEEESNTRALILLVGVGLFTILIIMLALYFYRENAREMRTARNQVTFVNQVSHELKTPLTNIRLYSELLEPRLTDSKDKSYLDVIIQEGSRLGRMINNVLTFNRGERGELKARVEKVELEDLIDDVLNKFTPLLKDKEMEIDYVQKKLSPVESDRDMIEQILINLISNAVKYGSEGKYLGIETFDDEEFCRIIISDRGPGIPREEREKIFKPFYRLDNSLSQATSGTGIGLSIAGNLAKETGSQLRLEASTEGARFSLSLPKKEIQ